MAWVVGAIIVTQGPSSAGCDMVGSLRQHWFRHHSVLFEYQTQIHVYESSLVSVQMAMARVE